MEFDHKALISDYYNQVLRPFFPHAPEKSSWMGLFNGVSGCHDFNIIPDYTMGFFKDSDYCIKKDLKVVHYTSLINAISIISNWQIRMYEVGSLADPKEMNSVWKKLPQLSKCIDINIDAIKKSFFIFSMCDYPAILSDPPLEFNMWRLYGDSGKGVGLVFKVNADVDDLFQYYFSNVRYDDAEIINKILEEHMKFSEIHNCNIGGLEDIIIPLSAFHKEPIYNLENEIRIVKKKHYLHNMTKDFGYDYKNGKESAYLKLPIDESIGSRFPGLELDKIVIGYQYNDQDVNGIANTFQKICNQKEKHIGIGITLLRDYFRDQ